MINFLIIYLFTFCSILIVMNFFYFVNIFKTKRFVQNSKFRVKFNKQSDKKIDMLIILPCLREQNIIKDSIDYFLKLNRTHVNLSILISCTKRETISNQEYHFTKTTAEIAREYIDSLKENDVEFFIYEANDFDNGDRATQMNEATNIFLKTHKNIDMIAVFDADSRPDINTLEEVAYEYKKDNNTVFQQPENYVYAVENMEKNSLNKISLSNGIYQNMWTVIREIPMFLNYSKNRNRFLYMNGHGMFFPTKIYKRIQFPEHEITDGTHIGFRVSMLKEKFKPLSTFGYTDPPHKLSQLPQQHKRWFGGVVRVNSCAKWAKKQGKKQGIFYFLSAYWDHIRWAITANIFIVSFLLNFGLVLFVGNYLFKISLSILTICFLLYCYIFPIVSAKIMKNDSRVSCVTFLLVPLAILFKSFGPDLFIIEKIFKRKIKYTKCER